MARRLGLTKARHNLQDGREEGLWIQKESQIRYCFYGTLIIVYCLFIDVSFRLINAMTLLDVAFVFFSNFPSRLATPELRFDLHCEEDLFASPHPFSEPSFKLSRNLTVYEAFKSLFSKEKTQPRDATIANPLGLGVVDMFTLVHRMFPNCLFCNYCPQNLVG